MWPKHLKHRSVAMLESGEHPDSMCSVSLLYSKCKVSPGSRGEPMYQMHLAGHINTSLWPKFHTHTSHTTIYVVYSRILVSSLMLDFQILFPAGSCRSEQCLSSTESRLCCHQRSLSCFQNRQMSRLLVATCPTSCR